MTQLLLGPQFKPQSVFGGSLLNRGTAPKCARPLDAKLPMHLVLRAERSTMRMPKFYARTNALVDSLARKWHVRVYEYANVGNHLHLLIRVQTRAAWRGFIRELSGRIALMTRVRWLHRPFTRVIKGWRAAYRAVKNYVQLNRLEAEDGLTRPAARALMNLRTRFG